MKLVQTDRPNEASAEFIKQEIETLLGFDTASSQNMWERNLQALKVYVYNHSDPEEEVKMTHTPTTVMKKKKKFHQNPGKERENTELLRSNIPEWRGDSLQSAQDQRDLADQVNPEFPQEFASQL